jgi:hypothetical protein
MENREFDACARSYGVSVCKQIGPLMMETLPRELRDLIYHSLHDPYTADPQVCVQNDQDSNSDTGGSLSEAMQKSKPTAPLDIRFSFLKRHYFRASYMGVGFVKELINTHFKAVPFRIRAEDLFTICGHQEFFLVDKFGLGRPLGELLGRVEVLIT